MPEDMTPSPEDAEPAGSTDTVPLSALGMPDEKEQMQPPAVGDEVSYQVVGKVTSISGDSAIIERTSINGNPVGDTDADDTGDTEDSLGATAGAMDNSQFGSR